MNNTNALPTQPAENTRPADRSDRLPRLSRNSWARPDLARMMGNEIAYAPYITPASTPRREPRS